MERSARKGAGARVLLTVVLGMTLAGCYRTTELAGPVPEPGTRIVAELTPAGMAQMEAWIGADAEALEARVVETRPEEWVLSILRVDHRGMPSIQWNGEHVAFPPETLRSVQERTLDGVRTGIFTAGVAAALYVLARNFMWAWVSGETGEIEDPVQ